MRKLIFKISFILLLLPTISFAQETPREIIDEFFKKYESSGIEEAIDQLYGNSKWLSKASDQIIQLKNKAKLDLENEEYIGKMHGYEEIVAKSLSSSYKLYSYLVKYDRQPIRFTFQFYKPVDKWTVYSFKYDGELSNEMEEAAKIYYEINKF